MSTKDTKLKVGTVVKLKLDDYGTRSGYLADLQMDLMDRSMSGKRYDRLVAAIEAGDDCVIAGIDPNDGDEPLYELKTVKHGAAFPFVLPIEELIVKSSNEQQ